MEAVNRDDTYTLDLQFTATELGFDCSNMRAATLMVSPQMSNW